MCEHEWTIVYIEREPIGISCTACDETRPLGKEDPSFGPVAPGAIYRIPTPSGQMFWSLEHYQVQNELNRPSLLSLEFREAHDPSGRLGPG